ncbi:MAG: hypothetical protein ACRC5M_06760 [Anaeroplasmataceae bacterium]
MYTSETYLTCKRSKTMIWKMEDVERFFELTEDSVKTDNFDVKKTNENFKKFQLFVVKPRSRFNTTGEAKLGKREDLVYFEINGIDNFSSPNFVSYVFCGYAIGNSKTIKTLIK